MILRTRAPLGWKKISPGPAEFLNAKEVELLAELAVVAFLGFFELGQIVVQLLLGEKRSAVDALQLRVLFVAFPVGAGDGEQLKRLDLLGGRHMRAAAEVDEVGSQRVFGKDGVGFFGDQLALHGLIAVQLQPFFLGHVLALVGQVLRLQLPHLLLDFFEILGGERLGPLEVVIKTVFDGGTDAELGFRKQFEHRGGQQVRRRMAIHFECLGILRGQDLQRGIRFERAVQVPQVAVDFGDQGVIGEARADGTRDVNGRRARGDTLDTSVGKGDLKIAHGYPSGYQTNPSGPVWPEFLPRRVSGTQGEG